MPFFGKRRTVSLGPIVRQDGYGYRYDPPPLLEPSPFVGGADAEVLNESGLRVAEVPDATMILDVPYPEAAMNDVYQYMGPLVSVPPTLPQPAPYPDQLAVETSAFTPDGLQPSTAYLPDYLFDQFGFLNVATPEEIAQA